MSESIVRIYHSVLTMHSSPGAMALGATGDVSTTEEVYRACAEELKLAGVNWAFSPVADVNSNPLKCDPVIGARSFGDREHTPPL